jgi:para-nitrobenzyl esterase
MLGGTRDETREYWDPVSPQMAMLRWEDLADRIAAELPVIAPVRAMIDVYRTRLPDASPADIFYAMTTDGRSWRPQLIEAQARATTDSPAWMYQVDFASPIRPRRGAFHGIDIALLFGTLDAADAGTGTGAEAQTLSRLLQDRLSRFAATGDPNGAGLPAWPPYRLPERATMIFDVVSRLDHDPRAWQRALFAPYPYRQPGT